MSIRKEPFGTLADGRTVERWILEGKGGLTAAVLTYGATLQALVYDGIDVVLGYDTLEGYVHGESCQGATIGRCANRIADGRFTLGGVEYDVGRNKGAVHLHGGFEGFDRKLWTAQEVGQQPPSVAMTLTSPDGDEGYPGTLTARVTFTVTDDDRLRIEYTATTDKDTVVNLTNHSYFNLAGSGRPAETGDALDTVLTLYADAITATDALSIPTGELLPVDGTPFDFRQPKPIGRDIDAHHEQLRLAGGYDHNFVLGTDRVLRLAARAVSPRSGLALTCQTDLPGVQLYTANGLGKVEGDSQGEPAGKGGQPLLARQAFCLETQFFPDAIHHDHFPSTVLRAGETYRSCTIYGLSKA